MAAARIFVLFDCASKILFFFFWGGFMVIGINLAYVTVDRDGLRVLLAPRWLSETSQSPGDAHGTLQETARSCTPSNKVFEAAQVAPPHRQYHPN